MWRRSRRQPLRRVGRKRQKPTRVAFRVIAALVSVESRASARLAGRGRTPGAPPSRAMSFSDCFANGSQHFFHLAGRSYGDPHTSFAAGTC